MIKIHSPRRLLEFVRTKLDSWSHLYYLRFWTVFVGHFIELVKLSLLLSLLLLLWLTSQNGHFNCRSACKFHRTLEFQPTNNKKKVNKCTRKSCSMRERLWWHGKWGSRSFPREEEKNQKPPSRPRWVCCERSERRACGGLPVVQCALAVGVHFASHSNFARRKCCAWPNFELKDAAAKMWVLSKQLCDIFQGQ